MRLLVRTLSVAAPEDAAGGGGSYDHGGGGGGFGDGAGTAGLVLYHPETGLPEPRLLFQYVDLWRELLAPGPAAAVAAFKGLDPAPPLLGGGGAAEYRGAGAGAGELFGGAASREDALRAHVLAGPTARLHRDVAAAAVYDRLLGALLGLARVVSFKLLDAAGPVRRRKGLGLVLLTI